MNQREDQLQSAAAKLGIGHYSRHVFLCTGPSCCTPEEGLAAWETLKKEIRDRGLDHGPEACQRTKAGCLRICNHGPTMVVYPDGQWYHGMTAARIPEFVEQHLLGGRPIRELVFAENPLSSRTGGDRASS